MNEPNQSNETSSDNNLNFYGNINTLFNLDTHTRLSLGLAIHARKAKHPYDEPRISFEVDRIKVPPTITKEVSNLVPVAYLWSGVPIKGNIHNPVYTEEEIIELLALGWILDIEAGTFKFKLDAI